VNQCFFPHICVSNKLNFVLRKINFLPLLFLADPFFLFQDKLDGRKHPKDEKTDDYTRENTLLRPHVWSRLPRVRKHSIKLPHVFSMRPQVHKMTLVHSQGVSCARLGVLFREITTFLYFLVINPSFKAQTKVKFLPINTTPLIHIFHSVQRNSRGR